LRSRQEYTLFETAVGTCGIAWQVAGNGSAAPLVTAFQLPEATARLVAARTRSGSPPVKARVVVPGIAALINRVQRHFGGEPQDFRDVVVELAGVGDFARAVYKAARRIPAGKTLTYGELARAIGRPGAARAVGQALARNPIPLIIPCHRVLAAGNRPGGFSAPGGLATKAKMLGLEGEGFTGKAG